MTKRKTIKNGYSGNWRNVDRQCQLCEMDKRTEWHLETKDWVVAEKLGGGPFVVYKKHTKELTEDEWDDMLRIVGKVFDEFEIRVLMNIVEDHWHGHIITDEDVDLSDE